MSLPRAELFIDSNDPYQRNLYTALKHILITLPLAANRFCDYTKSATWSKSQVSSYKTPGVWKKNQGTNPKWTWHPDYPAGLPMSKCADMGTQLSLRKNFEYQTRSNQTSPLISEAVDSHELMMDFYEILQVKERRFGNCGDRTKMLMMYLWEHSTGIRRLEYAALAKFDHAVLIVNRHFNSRLHQVNTWGDDAWIIDAWYINTESNTAGDLFPANQLKKKFNTIKKFANNELAQISASGIFKPKDQRAREEEKGMINSIRLDLNVEKNPYPFGSCNAVSPDAKPEELLNAFDLFKFKYHPKTTQAEISSAKVMHKILFSRNIAPGIRAASISMLNKPRPQNPYNKETDLVANLQCPQHTLSFCSQ